MLLFIIAYIILIGISIIFRYFAHKYQKNENTRLFEHFFTYAFFITVALLFLLPSLRTIEFISDTLVIMISIDVILTVLFSILFIKDDKSKAIFKYELFIKSNYIKTNQKKAMYKFYIISMTYSFFSFISLLILWP